MRLIFLVLFLFNFFILFCQTEEVQTLTSNQFLNKNRCKEEKKITNSFDSTFIYISDTLTLPFFDDFSKNKFQKYEEDFNSINTSSTKYYKLIDNSSNPINSKEKFSSQITYRRTFSEDHLSYSDENLNPIQIKIGDLSKYPVSYESKNVYPPFYIYDSLENPNDKSDTIWLLTPDITQDSATQFFKKIADPSSVWLDDFAYHNYRFPLNPWSIGVATFDGLDQYGKAYELGSSISNYGDYLTSKPINLSNYNAADSIYLSFLYQSGGYGDMPEESDSIIIEFFAKDLNQWIWIWGDNGSNDLDFKVGHICLKNSEFFKNGFQFRFKNYGNLSGGFDQFHLDYVHLRMNSGIQDTLFKDFSWVYPINSLLKNYSSVPWDHYKNNPLDKMSNNVNLVIRNGSNISENNSLGTKINIKYNGNLENSIIIPGITMSNGNLNYQPRTTYSSLHDFSQGYHFDENKNSLKPKFDIIGICEAQFPNFNQNDTTFSEQSFENFYSYDDGSAEAAYGLIGAQSELAIQFTPYESDSIIGIMSNFVESGNDVSDKLFLLSIWDDIDGKPGNILYRDNIYFPRSPVYSNTNNNYHINFLNNKIKVNGKFYIGWKQLDSERLNIGFDKNNINNDKVFYSLNNGVSWKNSSVEGTIMLRPLFSTSLDSQLGIDNINNNIENIKIFPSPTHNFVTIVCDPEKYFGVEIYSLDGIFIQKETSSIVDLTNFPTGFYIFKTIGENQKNLKIFKH